MPERHDGENLDSTSKALAVFRTLRTNLALFSSFARRSRLKPEDYSGEDLGFLGVKPGEEQLKVHQNAVTSILVALVTQALSNYVELRGINTRLADPDLEKFLDGLKDRDSFFRGMKKTRNTVFHCRSRRAWRDGCGSFSSASPEVRAGAGSGMARAT